MPVGVDPDDIFLNGQWYRRNGNPASGRILLGRSTATIGLSSSVVPVTLATVNCPPLGPTDRIEVSGKVALVPNNANAKFWRTFVGGSLAQELALANQDGATFRFTVDPRGGSPTQQINGQDSLSGVAGVFRYGAANTAAPFTIEFIGQLSVGTDLLLLENYAVELVLG